MTALSDALSKPNNKKVVLAEITAGKHQPVWEKTWNPYLNGDPDFCVWASDITKVDDEEVLLTITEKTKGTKFQAYRGSIKYNKKDAEANNRASVSYSHGAYTLNTIDLSQYYSVNAYTWIAVTKKTAGVATDLIRASDSYLAQMAYTTGHDVTIKHGQTVTHTVPPGTDDGEYKVVVATRSGETFKLYINGTLVDTQTILFATNMTMATDVMLLAHPLLGDHLTMPAFIMYKTCLSDADRDAIVEGLMNYYGIGDEGPDAETLYTVPETSRVSDVKINGVALTLASSVADCYSTLESYYWDHSNIYVNSASDPSDWDNTTMVFLKFYFASETKNLNGVNYDGRLMSIPSLTLRVEEEFSGISQIGGGSLILSNGDRFFDPLRDLRWDAGVTVLKIGCDLADAVMAYSDYQAISTWNNDSWIVGDSFELKVIEIRERVDKEIPFYVYTRSEYPNIHEGHDGRSKQIVYNHCFGARAVCIDIEQKLFQVAGHPIMAIDRVRADVGGIMRHVTITDIDLTDARFIYPEWDLQQDVTVDLYGKVDSNGDLISNPADIIHDLLVTCGVTDINEASFTTAHDLYDRGLYYPEGKRVVSYAPFIYLGDPTSVLDVISDINATIGAYLYIDADGDYNIKVFEPQRVQDLEVFQETSIKSLEMELETENRISYLHLKYAKRQDEDWDVDYLMEKTRNQYFRDEKSRVKEEVGANIATVEDARLLANKLMLYKGDLNHIYKISFVDPKAMLLTPSQQIHLQFEYDTETEAYKHDLILEIYSISFDPTDLQEIQVVAGNRHGYGDKPGFWVEDDETLPARFSTLPGYGDGSIVWNKAWHRRIKDYARQNYGYWTDDNGFADPSDPESYIPSCVV